VKVAFGNIMQSDAAPIIATRLQVLNQLPQAPGQQAAFH